MALPEDLLNIDTPENVAFGYEIAGIGSRFLAALLDTLLIFLLQLLVNLTLILLALNFLGPDSLGAWAVGVLVLISFAFLWGYYIFFETLWNGQSPGKRLARLRVIRSDGSPITLTESVIRNLVRIVDFMPAYYGVGVIAMFASSQSRRLGDLAAGTLVVRERASVSLESLAALAPADTPPAILSTQFTLPSDFPVERLTAGDLELAEDFLRRRTGLSNSAILAHQILTALQERMGIPPPAAPYINPELLLAAIVQTHRERTEK